MLLYQESRTSYGIYPQNLRFFSHQNKHSNFYMTDIQIKR